RQLSLRAGRNATAFVHLTLVPYIASAGELKTKPTQHSVQKLREIGISPDALLCRADRRIPDDERSKISLFSNVQEEAVISVWDADTIYKIPQMLLDQGLDRDRKSTRLNSSHVKISYAVFCLKKKNTIARE